MGGLLTSTSSWVTPYLPFGPSCWVAFAHFSLDGGVIFTNSRDRSGGRSTLGSFGLRSARGPVGYIGPAARMGTGAVMGVWRMEGVEAPWFLGPFGGDLEVLRHILPRGPLGGEGDLPLDSILMSGFGVEEECLRIVSVLG